MDVLTACAYGIELDSINNPNHPVVTNVKKILGVDANISQLLSVLAPPIAKALKLEFLDLEATDYFDSLTELLIKERKLNKNVNKKRTDFLQLMVNSELDYDSNSDVESSPTVADEGGVEQRKDRKSKGTLRHDEITGQGLLFFIAGYHTTSSSLTHAVYYLSQNKDCQQRLYEELQTLDEFSYEKLVHMKYLNAVIDETLRLAPSLTTIQRECIQDYKLGNTGIYWTQKNCRKFNIFI